MIAQCIPLVWRTKAPRTVMWSITVLWVASAGIGYAGDVGFFPLLVSLYTVGAYLPRRAALTHAGAVGGVSYNFV